MVELLLVVSILGLLAGILIPFLEEETQSAWDSRRARDLRSLQAALAEHKRILGFYPPTRGIWIGDAPKLGGRGYDDRGYVPGLAPGFIRALPKDPNPEFPDGDAGYMYKSDGRNYKFVIHRTPDSFDEGNPFLDPVRPDSWMVSSREAYYW